MLSDFDYSLPKELIAQQPIEPRDSSLMMVLENNGIEHKKFRDIVSYLKPGDAVVMNNSKVSALKLGAKKISGGKVEILLLSRQGIMGKCLIRGKNVQAGTLLIFNDEVVTAKVVRQYPDGKFEIEFDRPGDDLQQILQSLSITPLPPYIKQKLDRSERYQTVYAEPPGSAAAPTAGLHFTTELLNQIEQMGINLAIVTLHIGTGTFLPVTQEALTSGKLESEYFKIEKKAADCINNTIKREGRLFVVGTSTMRALESSTQDGEIIPQEKSTDLFIFPEYKFKVPLHALLTNFHLPRSTLLMLVSAYAGRERILNAYKAAIERRYRFYSFGDVMLIIEGG